MIRFHLLKMLFRISHTSKLHKKDIKALKENSKDTYLLIPGYGAQGANIEDIRALIQENKNGVINVSRGYTAGINESDFRKVLSQRAQQLAKELSECIK